MVGPRIDVAPLESGPASHGFGWLTLPLYRDHLTGSSGPRDSVETVAVGARLGVTPVGLAVAERWPNGAARLVSAVVRPAFRRMGCARRMLAQLEQLLAGRGVRTLVVGGMGTSANDLQGTLARLGFSAWSKRGTLWELTADRLDALVHRRTRWLSARLRATPWTSLAPARLERLASQQAHAPWYPESLSPFRYEASIEPVTSLALLAGEDIAGWAIGHRAAPDVVHYATIFVRPDLRHLGAGAGLFFTALARHCTSPATRRCRGQFLIRDESTRMAQLIERRIRPVASTWSTYFEANKALA